MKHYIAGFCILCVLIVLGVLMFQGFPPELLATGHIESIDYSPASGWGSKNLTIVRFIDGRQFTGHGLYDVKESWDEITLFEVWKETSFTGDTKLILKKVTTP